MAITKIHSIESTLNLAIAYIVKPNKTEEQKYVEGYACTVRVAAEEMLKTQTANGYKGKNLAFHLIQSFSPGEATPEQAHELGVKLAQKLLGGQYEYVLSTHVDKEHIHNHIIINAVNFETGKSFSTEHDRKNNPAWQNIRNISDELCREYGLSVISNPERGKGKSRYEWEQERAGNSWKAKLKISIDECIKYASSFDDFLERMKALDYEIKHGKHIAFRAKGQERFTRAKTLGYYYTEEQIRYRIERRLMWRERQKTSPEYRYIPRGQRFIAIEGKVEENEGLKRWAMLQNMKNASKLINELSERGFDNPEQVRAKQIDLYDERLDIQDEIKQVEAQMTDLSLQIKQLQTYHETKEVNQKYNSAKNKDKFFREHEQELLLYQVAKKNVQGLLNENGRLPAVSDLENQRASLKEKKGELMQQYRDIKKEITEVEKLKASLENLAKTEPNLDKSKTDNLT